MAEVSEVYECEICGIVVQVVTAGAGTMSCCDQPMTLRQSDDKSS